MPSSRTYNILSLSHFYHNCTIRNLNTIQELHLSSSSFNQSINMPMRRTHRTAPRTTVRTTRTRPSLKTRLLGGGRTTRRTPATTTTTTTTRTTRTTNGAHAAPVHHHKRHATMGDKVSGALMKLRGSLTRRPGLKVSSIQNNRSSTANNDHSLLVLDACMALTDVIRAVMYIN